MTIKPAQTRQCNATTIATIIHPRVEGNTTHVEVDLEDVRAADSVRLSYDFERDGWKIEQARFFSWPAGDAICDPGWVEVAFVQAWGSRVDTEDD